VSPARKKTVLVDCDTGVDDAISLLYLLLDPEVEVCGITTVFGNISAAEAAHNSLAVLEVVGRAGQVPVAVGSEVTLTGEAMELATWVHGENGMGGIELPTPSASVEPESGAEMIVRLARQRPGEVHILAHGPMTNVALALLLEPRLPQLVDGITIMGGAADAPGNITPAAEANIWHDPEAAQALLRASWPVTIVPLDATMREVMNEGHRQALLDSPSPAANFGGRVLDFYFDFYTGIYGQRSSACHDVLAAGIAVGDVAPVRAIKTTVEVDTGYGPGRGQTIVDTRTQYKDVWEVEGARHTVVLDTGGKFSDAVVARLTGS
jgi:inosine-uridine nucleoside N-ribohydrolase